METVFILTFENNNGTTYLHAACTSFDDLCRCISLRSSALDLDDYRTIKKLLEKNERASFEISDGTIKIWQLEVNKQHAIFI